MVLWLLCLATLLSLSRGSCVRENIQIEHGFQLNKYLGLWYEQKWLAQAYIPADELYQDYSHYYSLDPDRQSITIYISGRDPRALATCFYYTSQILVTETPGKLLFNRTDGQGGFIVGDYWVVSTDYTQYALVYGCRLWNDSGHCEQQDSWIWSRTQTLDSETLERLETMASGLCINTSLYLSTNQNNECDANRDCAMQTFDVKENFDIHRYVGKWHEQKWLAQSFIPDEQLFQDYTHQYVMSPDNASVTIYIGGRDPVTMETCFYRQATLLMTATPGKMIYRRKNYQGDLVDGDYWVLNTDYVTYALVLGCREKNDTGHCVKEGSWLWSREPTLNPAILASMETNASSTFCVDTSKYLTTQHRAACRDCAVALFKPQPNFNEDRFLSLWFLQFVLSPPASGLLEDYRHSYLHDPADNNTLKIYASGRDPYDRGECKEKNAGQLIRTEEAGKYLYRRDGENGPVTSPYWVVATDYRRYAVVYGCRRLGDAGLCAQPDAWVWTRGQDLPSETASTVRGVIKDLCLKFIDLSPVPQNQRCFVSAAPRLGALTGWSVGIVLGALPALLWQI